MNTKTRNTFRSMVVLAGFLIMNLPTVITVVLLRNLGGLIGSFIETGADDKFDFAGIFAQTKDARLTVHWILPTLLGILFLIVVFCSVTKIGSGGARIVLTMILFLVLFGISLVSSLALTRVNDIRFCDLLAELLPLLGKI